MPYTINMFLDKFRHPRSQSRSSSPALSSSYSRATSRSSATTFDFSDNLALQDDMTPLWATVEASLHSGIRSTIRQWGEQILCDSFSVIFRPKLSKSTSNLNESPKTTYYCVLFHRNLLFFLPDPFRPSALVLPSVYTLVGAINVQRDLKDVHLRTVPTVSPRSCSSTEPPKSTLELSMLLHSSRVEHRVSLECNKGRLGREDRLNKWDEMLRVIKRFSVSSGDPAPFDSFILPPVVPSYWL